MRYHKLTLSFVILIITKIDNTGRDVIQDVVKDA